MQVQRRKKVRPRDGLKEGLAPRLPNKPLFYYKHYAETNAFVPKIDERYELYVEIAIKPKILSE